MTRPELPAALSIVQRDFRPPRRGGEDPIGADTASAQARHHGLRIVQFNVERCYKLDGILAELRSLDADIVALQEVDIGCERSGCCDGLSELGRALGLNCAFVAEFEEVHSPLREPATQGGGAWVVTTLSASVR
jgi:hypothetical protein